MKDHRIINECNNTNMYLNAMLDIHQEDRQNIQMHLGNIIRYASEENGPNEIEIKKLEFAIEQIDQAPVSLWSQKKLEYLRRKLKEEIQKKE